MIISCDWGTSSCRVRLVDDAGTVLRSFGGAKGIAGTFVEWQKAGLPDAARVGFYQAVLQSAITQLGGELEGVPVVVSGMASSSIGMMELAYHALPFLVSGQDLRPFLLPACADFPHTLLLVPGVRSEDDVMRGEETQLIGCGVASGLFVFPGTHSKHIVVDKGRAVAFSTFMTGEFFGLLSRQSILSASVAEGVASDEAFLAGVDAAVGSGLLHSAFAVRTNQLFGRFSKSDNYQYLSGLMIGEELKGMAHQPVVLVAVAPLRQAYAMALQRLGFMEIEEVDADGAVLEGHRRLFERFKNP